MLVHQQRLADDVADRHARVERRVRVLEDHLDASRADRRRSPPRRGRRGRAPSNSTRPAVGWMRLEDGAADGRSCRSPISPTRPSVSPRRTSNVTPVHRVHGADLALEHDPARDAGSARARSSTRTSVSPFVAAAGDGASCRHLRRLRAADREWQQALWRPGSVARSSGAAAQHSSVARAARRERAAGRQVRQVGRQRPRWSGACRAAARRAAARCCSSPTVYGWRGRAKSGFAGPLSTMRPAYITSDPVGTSRRPRPGRA